MAGDLSAVQMEQIMRTVVQMEVEENTVALMEPIMSIAVLILAEKENTVVPMAQIIPTVMYLSNLL